MEASDEAVQQDQTATGRQRPTNSQGGASSAEQLYGFSVIQGDSLQRPGGTKDGNHTYNDETMLLAKDWRPADVVPPIAAFALQDMSLRGCLTSIHKTDTLLCQDLKCEMPPHEE